MSTTQIEVGQVYEVGGGAGRFSVRWRILGIDGDTANAVRVRKADGERWVWDESKSRDFPVSLIDEHWRRVA
jgi:hypothetical protein